MQEVSQRVCNIYIAHPQKLTETAIAAISDHLINLTKTVVISVHCI